MRITFRPLGSLLWFQLVLTSQNNKTQQSHSETEIHHVDNADQLSELCDVRAETDPVTATPIQKYPPPKWLHCAMFVLVTSLRRAFSGADNVM